MQDGTNWYVYVNNNPLNFKDPTGLSGLDNFQTALDFAGMILGPAGMVADVLNVGVSLARGDLGGAAVNAFAIIPGIGDAAKGAKKANAAKVAKTMDNAKTVAKMGEKLKGAEKAVEKSADVAKLRRQAVNTAWKQEKELVESTGKGSREWTKMEKKQLLDNGKVKGYDGHHMDSVKNNPDKAGDPNNIEFQSRNEHLDAHGGNWKNQTSSEGKSINRQEMKQNNIN